ncbi:Txndc15p [Halocaridina rubra]|uniref:Txndc15p n=1 Tax=Halocaridina rubra TaxID=373956 RepID=A0AAN8ZX88_HALRR
MKKHPPNFQKCVLVLLLTLTCVQPLTQSDDCDTEIENESCPKLNEGRENVVDNAESGRSVFVEKHGCHGNHKADENLVNSDLNTGSCRRKEELEEEEDQSELSMLGEQAKISDSDKSCDLDKKDAAASTNDIEEGCEGKQVKTDSLLTTGNSDNEKEKTSTNIEDDAEPHPPVQMTNEEAENADQDAEAETAPLQLREILLKLKPEGLTDNDDEQTTDFSVTESIGEDGEVEEDLAASSGSAEKQTTGLDIISGDSSKNGSGSGVSKKAVCLELNTTESSKDVEVINATLLMKLLQVNPSIINRSAAGPCHLIYFFSPYCPFSVVGSPYVNAMARSLKNIPVYGLDSIEHHSVNARYGVMGTPTLLLFHNGIGVGRYNASEFSVAQLLAFINHYTDQTVLDINVTSSDFRANLPSQVAEGRPYALWASWIFLLSCAAWLFLTSELCARLTEAILNNWREAEAQNDQD